MITLYGESMWDSPWVLTAYVALREKGIDFETRALDLTAGEQSTPGYRDASLTARVPSIDHDGFVLSESQAIVEYLEEAFPAPDFPPLYPDSIQDRARARQIMAWLRTDLGALRAARPTTAIFFAPVSTPLSERALAARDKLFSVAERLVPEVGGSIFAYVTMADVDLALALQRLIANGDAVPARLVDYAREIWRRPSVQSFVAQDRPKMH